MNTTYAGVSESSATNYLFLFAQRTLALQNTPPTPPPLNVVGLPCVAICLLWDWLRPEAEEAAEAEATQRKVTLAIEQAVAEIRERVYSEFKGSEELKAAEELKAVMARSTADKLHSSTGSWSFSTGSWSFTGSVRSKEAKQGEEKLFIGEEAVEEEAEEEAAAGEINVKEEESFAERIAPLAEHITAYILEGILTAQEKRWRTNMKRDTENNFRTQREAAAKVEKEMQRQRDAINEVHSKLDRLIARQDSR